MIELARLSGHRSHSRRIVHPPVFPEFLGYDRLPAFILHAKLHIGGRRNGRSREIGVELAVTTAGNLVLDVIVKQDGEKYFWTPIPVTDDYVNPSIIDLVVASGYLLDEVIDLVKCMGIVFNPKFYLSLEDFGLEYAAAAFEGLGDLF